MEYSKFLLEASKRKYPELSPTVKPGRYGIKVVKKEFDDDEEDQVAITTVYYDIILDGKKVGNLETTDYFGYIRGELHNKPLPELSAYGRATSSSPLSNLHAFLKSKTGARWANKLKKYNK